MRLYGFPLTSDEQSVHQACAAALAVRFHEQDGWLTGLAFVDFPLGAEIPKELVISGRRCPLRPLTRSAPAAAAPAAAAATVLEAASAAAAPPAAALDAASAPATVAPAITAPVPDDSTVAAISDSEVGVANSKDRERRMTRSRSHMRL